MKQFPMTVEGAAWLREEVHRLKTVERPRATAAVATARAHGDLRENAEYNIAREEQAFLEGRIRELETKLARAQVIDVSKISHTGRVIFGTTVELREMESGKEVSYRIVGEDEADLEQGKISCQSPLARSLIAKHEQDEVELQTGQGLVKYQILRVLHQ